MSVDISGLAAILDEAVCTATAIPQLSTTSELTLDEAYAVQAAGVRLRIARGDAVTGVKLGFTSKAKAEQMGVSDVIIGVLTESTQVADGGVVDVGSMIHPRIEPEIAFRLGAEGVAVAAALEVIDSRYLDFRFNLPDVVADNTSAARFVVGEWHLLDVVRSRLDLTDLPVTMRIDGEPVAAGSSADILGDPVLALDTAARLPAQFGLTLPDDAIILAGAATAAVPLPAGATVEAAVAGLGSVHVVTCRDGVSSAPRRRVSTEPGR